TPNCQFKTIIPSTYVPARNIIFLTFALSYTEATDADTIFIGANAIDYSGYPDCRPAFFKAFREIIKTGTKAGAGAKGQGRRIKVKAPLLYKSKGEIVKLAKRLKVPLKLTWSCYKGGRRPCGICDSCILRVKGFKEAGIKDPLYGGKNN
ncbi:MAG: 7-cyano-7-deazaguanine synthase, partial [Candidatus Omnitrophica bacterium]|nr:7-cyano-7-deazaguanine synthase [Candidatus Omnitrophota bacterium]